MSERWWEYVRRVGGQMLWDARCGFDRWRRGMVLCGRCDGYGQIGPEGDFNCQPCGGTGELERGER